MSTALVPAEDLANTFPVLAGGAAMEAFHANIGDDDFSVHDLDKVTVPSGGGTTWEIPGLSGTDAVKELRGVIVGVIARRSYWETSVDEGEQGTPPDCASDDGKIGRGLFGVGSTEHPSGDCATCPMNTFQTNDKGRTSKPCKEQRLLLLVREHAVLPTQVQLAPTSMKVMKKFMLRLSSQEVPYYRAIVSLGLKRVSGKPDYSVVEPSLVGTVGEEAGEAFRSIGEPILRAYAQFSARPATQA